MSEKTTKEQELQILNTDEIEKEENSTAKNQDIDELIELEEMLDEFEEQVSNYRRYQKPQMPPMKLTYHNGAALDD
ncbi:MAG: hypothetical protein AB7T22_14360 [Calditrichaceae bacterium]